MEDVRLKRLLVCFSHSTSEPLLTLKLIESSSIESLKSRGFSFFR